ncbi:MAG: FKBP-type peptidyl-prolyl cis-trans isomerase [candidate division SR1 bacterium]|nr:FKBP-type peptidyl-prolyl cis-trans isomerase [candidate division SR1 bacterium]
MKKLTYSILGLLMLSSLFLFGCNSALNVKVGDTVTIQYTSTFPDGTSFETSGATFVVGSKQIIAGLDNGVVGMKVGKTKTITVTPDQGYGSLYNTFQLQKISKVLFDKMTGTTGDTAGVRTLAGIRGVLKGVEKDAQGNEMVLRDINPRETWDNVIYKVTLVSKK